MAPTDHLPHGVSHEGVEAGDEVDEAAVVDLPENEVELVDVVAVLRVRVLLPRRVAEVQVEDVTARLHTQHSGLHPDLS